MEPDFERQLARALDPDDTAVATAARAVVLHSLTSGVQAAAAVCSSPTALASCATLLESPRAAPIAVTFAVGLLHELMVHAAVCSRVYSDARLMSGLAWRASTLKDGDTVYMILHMWATLASSRDLDAAVRLVNAPQVLSSMVERVGEGPRTPYFSATLNTLQFLSLHRENKLRMTETPGLVNTCVRLAKHADPGGDFVQGGAIGVLSNLGEIEVTRDALFKAPKLVEGCTSLANDDRVSARLGMAALSVMLQLSESPPLHARLADTPGLLALCVKRTGHGSDSFAHIALGILQHLARLPANRPKLLSTPHLVEAVVARVRSGAAGVYKKRDMALCGNEILHLLSGPEDPTSFPRLLATPSVLDLCVTLVKERPADPGIVCRSVAMASRAHAVMGDDDAELQELRRDGRFRVALILCNATSGADAYDGESVRVAVKGLHARLGV